MKLKSGLVLIVVLLTAVFGLSFYQTIGNGKINFTQDSLFPQSDLCSQVIKHKYFTCCYSESHEQSAWVVYVLTQQKATLNLVKRKDSFKKDELVKEGSADPDDYKYSGFDKGHLCPAGDMNWSELSMSETFLMSNISPQVHSFNSGIWEKLEARVRKWAINKDSVLIITGGILNGNLKKIGNKNKISVPEYFYKVIYDFKNSAIAFLIPVEGSENKNYLNYTISIDALEAFSGIDFFKGMDDSKEVLLERSTEFSNWINN